MKSAAFPEPKHTQWPAADQCPERMSHWALPARHGHVGPATAILPALHCAHRCPSASLAEQAPSGLRNGTAPTCPEQVGKQWAHIQHLYHTAPSCAPFPFSLPTQCALPCPPSSPTLACALRVFTNCRAGLLLILACVVLLRGVNGQVTIGPDTNAVLGVTGQITTPANYLTNSEDIGAHAPRLEPGKETRTIPSQRRSTFAMCLQFVACTPANDKLCAANT